MTLPCPCRPPAASPPYADCCGRFHAGPLHLQAPDAESLMRSRYSACVLDLVGYLHDTWHPTTRPARIEPNPAGMKWLGLDIRRQVRTDVDHATVEFVARSKLGGRASRLHETSRFVRENGHWVYLDGSFREGTAATAFDQPAPVLGASQSTRPEGQRPIRGRPEKFTEPR